MKNDGSMRVRGSAIAIALSSLTIGAGLSGCGEEATAPPVEAAPLVGALEVPISLRLEQNAPPNAIRIEMTSSELRVDGTAVATFERGRPPASETAAEGLTSLRAPLTAAAATRHDATIIAHGTVPYGTWVRVIESLLAAGVNDLYFAVRASDGSPRMQWMPFLNPTTGPERGPVTFATAHRPWSDVTAAWSEMYDACRAGQYIDCDGAPATPLEGGEFQLTLWPRGQGMQLQFKRVAPEGEAAPAAPAAPRRTEMIEGVPAAAGAAPEEAPPPDTVGVFAFRATIATQSPSAISTTARPVCGSNACPTIIESDAETPVMRVLSLVGAAFPTGSAAPVLAFRHADWHD